MKLSTIFLAAGLMMTAGAAWANQAGAMQSHAGPELIAAAQQHPVVYGGTYDSEDLHDSIFDTSDGP